MLTPDAAFAEPGLADLLARARRCASLADDAAAKRLYLDALGLDPTSLEALLELARLAMRSGHRSAAATAYRQAIFCHPLEPTARVNLGNLLIEAGEFEEARALFAEAVGCGLGAGNSRFRIRSPSPFQRGNIHRHSRPSLVQGRCPAGNL